MNLKTIIGKVVSWFKGEAKTVVEEIPTFIEKELDMNAPVTAATIATPASNVNTAVQIALALKAIDASQSVEAIQAATNAALAVMYPVAA
jgi:hypothetical protein